MHVGRSLLKTYVCSALCMMSVDRGLVAFVTAFTAFLVVAVAHSEPVRRDLVDAVQIVV
jgi:hypothetical protein